MADWYVSSAGFAAIAAFVPSAVYSVGNIVKPTAPALKAQWVFRCTTAGTASTEPAWTTGNNSTISTGGVTFTNVTGQSTYGWSGAAGDMPTLLGAVGANRFTAGDRLFVSSDHSESMTSNTTYGATTTPAYGVCQVLSVNRAGSVPPVAADLTAGATCNCTNVILIETISPVYFYGVNFVCSGVVGFQFNSVGLKTAYFDTCQLYLSGAGNSAARMSNQASCTTVLYNSTLRFANAAQCVSAAIAPWEILWLNTPSAIAGATFPSAQLFNSASSTAYMAVTARGVDLSAITSALAANTGAGNKFLLDSCRIASGVSRLNLGSISDTRDLVELVNCYDGTNIISESYQPAGAVTTETTITLSGGATDNVGTFSHKMVSNTNVDKYANTLNSFWMDANYATTGSAKTATVEIISSASLNNDEISLMLEYEGTAASSVASIATSLPANVLTAASAVTSSSATWNSLPATPVKQRLQVTFTPRTAGRVRGQVRLGKASTTVYVDPRVVIT